MRIERTRNASRNIVFGILLKFYQILIPFLMRTAMIYFMGVQYLGLNSLFISILQVLNLVELGVGSAMVFSMYEPIVTDDADAICALMNLYRTYYRIIGVIIAIIGVVLTPFIPKLINGDVPVELNVYILYLLNLGATVLSYWLFAYKNCLLDAHQRNDISSKVQLGLSTVQYILQFIAICIFKNYYVFLIIALGTQALTNIVTSLVVSHMFPDYRPQGTIDKSVKKKINERIRDLFTSKIGAVIVNSADTIVISAFLGLTTLAIYQNYYFVLTSVIGFVTIIFQACIAGIGNSVIVETKEKNYADLKKFTFIISWIAGFCTCCFLCLYQPFMEMWVGRELMLGYSAVICFCIYYYVYEINHLLNTYKDASGIWHEDRFRPLVTALSNLGLNLVLVQFWGIYGVILSTVLTMVFIGMPWLLHNLFSTLFEKKHLKNYLKHLAFYVWVCFVTCVLCYVVCSRINFEAWKTFLIRLIICFIVPNVVFWLIYHKNETFKQTMLLVQKMTKGKIYMKKKNDEGYDI